MSEYDNDDTNNESENEIKVIVKNNTEKKSSNVVNNTNKQTMNIFEDINNIFGSSTTGQTNTNLNNNINNSNNLLNNLMGIDLIGTSNPIITNNTNNNLNTNTNTNNLLNDLNNVYITFNLYIALFRRN
jgi:hypothetical protein